MGSDVQGGAGHGRQRRHHHARASHPGRARHRGEHPDHCRCHQRVMQPGQAGPPQPARAAPDRQPEPEGDTANPVARTHAAAAGSGLPGVFRGSIARGRHAVAHAADVVRSAAERYWRAMCMRSSASVSSISFPLTSIVTLWMVPVNLNGLA
jgi:hypothetical protein